MPVEHSSTNIKIQNTVLDYTLLYYLINRQEIEMKILYENKQINNTYNTKFLRLIIDSSLSWKVHIDELMSKLNKACYVIRSVKLLMSLRVLRMIFFPYFHSIISYSIILGGNSFHSKIIFKIKKRIIRVIMGSSGTDFCCRFFYKFGRIASPISVYIFSITVCC